jgi:hypothetical protein
MVKGTSELKDQCNAKILSQSYNTNAVLKRIVLCYITLIHIITPK